MKLQHSDAVWQIQRALRNLSETEPTLTRIVPDGIFGPETVAAVKDFQQLRGLPLTGEVDSETWNALFQAAAEQKAARQTPQSVPLFSADTTLRLNDSGDSAPAVQIMLCALAKKYANFAEIELSGKLTASACREIRHFQHCALLPETGEVDTATWDMLCLWYEMQK